MKRKVKKQIIFDPNCPFEVAKTIAASLDNLCFSDRVKALRWACEVSGFSYPIKIQGNSV